MVIFALVFAGALVSAVYPSLYQNMFAASFLRGSSNFLSIRSGSIPYGLSRAKLWLADSYIEADRLTEAGSWLEDAECQPADPLTCHYLGKIAFHQGEYLVSIEYFEAARDFNSLIVFADSIRSDSNYPISEAYYEAAYRLFPDDAVMGFAQVLVAQGKFQQASTVLARSIDRFPNDFRISAWKNLLGSSYLHSEKWELAQSVFEDLLRRSPNDASLHLGLGWAYYGSSDLPKAYQGFTNAIQIDPDLWNAYYGLGLIELKQENVLPAIDWFNGALAHSPEEANIPSIYYELAWAYRLSERSEEALNAIRLAIETSPVPRESYYARQGAIYEWAERYVEAIESYLLAVDLNPANVQLLERLRGLGNSFIKMNEWEYAKTAFEEIINRAPRDANAYLGLGWSYYGASDLPNAYQAFTASIRIEPENWQPYYALGLIELKRSNVQQAIEWFHDALEILPEGDNPSSIYYELAWAYRLAGREPDAVNAIELAVALSPSPRDTYYARQGSIYEWVGLNEEAAAAYRLALDLNPDNIAAIQGLLRTEGE
jgi:tetratricopeptide (TPR) repeat protein